MRAQKMRNPNEVFNEMPKAVYGSERRETARTQPMNEYPVNLPNDPTLQQIQTASGAAMYATERMEKEIVALREINTQLEKEVLSLYRRLDGADKQY